MLKYVHYICAMYQVGGDVIVLHAISNFVFVNNEYRMDHQRGHRKEIQTALNVLSAVVVQEEN